MVEPDLNREGWGNPAPHNHTMDYQSEITRAQKFWNPQSMTEARQMILPAEDWINYTEQAMNLLITPKVREVLKPDSEGYLGSDCLEIGCGIGRLLPPMLRYFGTAFGIDISKEMVQMSCEYLRDQDDCEVILCDGRTFPIGMETIDFVYSIICFQHIHELEMINRYLEESYRVLTPGGVIRIQTHKGNPGRSGMHGHFFPTLEAFTQLFTDAGLKVVEKQEGLGHPDYLWVTAQK